MCTHAQIYIEDLAVNLKSWVYVFLETERSLQLQASALKSALSARLQPQTTLTLYSGSLVHTKRASMLLSRSSYKIISTNCLRLAL